MVSNSILKQSHTSGDYQTEKRVAQKKAAIPFPDFVGKSVLDVGCDHGYFSFMAARQGASKVLGLDRNRDVRGKGPTNLIAQNTAIAKFDSQLIACQFEHINLGKQWHEYGKFDVILVMSMYHHWYEQCGDHRAIWFWLWRHCAEQVLFEGPMDDSDPVVRANVSKPGFMADNILAEACHYFDAEYIGPALHEPTRVVYRFTPKPLPTREYGVMVCGGAGGAAPAFEYESGRRIKELKSVLGFRPFPGSLNLRLFEPFDFNRGYYRSQILDVTDRSKGLDSEWSPRWMRFYPVKIDGTDAIAVRFENEKYSDVFVELVAPVRMRDQITTTTATLCR
jgi:2-polyprenyl-3-methyl-5-hydroxy-6-metoxy-1,4-benzoquinol methylase